MRESAIRITSDGEKISLKEFKRRIKDPNYCINCGAPLLGLARIIFGSCGPCSSDYYIQWSNSAKGKPGSGGLFGSE